MELNEKKSKVMKVNKRGEGNINIQRKGGMLEQVDSYTYLGTLMAQTGMEKKKFCRFKGNMSL
jgi:hypothetical protein